MVTDHVHELLTMNEKAKKTEELLEKMEQERYRFLWKLRLSLFYVNHVISETIVNTLFLSTTTPSAIFVMTNQMYHDSIILFAIKNII